MKNNLLLTVALIAFVSVSAAAQNEKDFILTLNRDTIFGKVSIQHETDFITFKHKRKKVYFHPKTLQAFGIYHRKQGYQIYKSIKNAKGEHLFAETITQGEVQLYRYTECVVKNYGRAYKTVYYIGYSDDKLVSVTPRTYEATMRVLVKDRPNLEHLAANLSYDEVPMLVASYNQQ